MHMTNLIVFTCIPVNPAFVFILSIGNTCIIWSDGDNCQTSQTSQCVHLRNCCTHGLLSLRFMVDIYDVAAVLLITCIYRLYVYACMISLGIN